MIQGMIFDLDGTLVQTERLKAISYAEAVADLCDDQITHEEVLDAYREVVGLSRRDVAMRLVERFDLAVPASKFLAEFDVTAPWQAFVQIRLKHYARMLSDPEVLIQNQWPQNRAILDTANVNGCKTGLATMSTCDQVQKVIKVLQMQDEFDFIASRDDVECGKPDPEIYNLVAEELKLPAAQCLVLEDSVAGVTAALAAGMWCIAVTTSFTKDQMHACGILEERWIVDEPERVAEVVRSMVSDRKG